MKMCHYQAQFTIFRVLTCLLLLWVRCVCVLCVLCLCVVWVCAVFGCVVCVGVLLVFLVVCVGVRCCVCGCRSCLWCVAHTLKSTEYIYIQVYTSALFS